LARNWGNLDEIGESLGYARDMLRLPKTLIGAIVVAAVAGVGLFPDAAGAATAFVRWVPPDEYVPEGAFIHSITYAADPGETNKVTITSDGSGIFHISDAGAAITPGTGCTAVALHKVTCGNRHGGESESAEELIVFAGDGNDSVDASAVRPSHAYVTAPKLYGGGGDDVLLGTEVEYEEFREWLVGGAGDDVLRGGDRPEALGSCGFCYGNDLRGGPGDDRLVGGPGHDVLAGGAGADVLDGRGEPDAWTPDWADYTDSPGPVVVTLDDRPGDGRAGENDHIRNVESVFGSEFGDRLIGNAGPNIFFGHGDADVLHGRGGNDWLKGGIGRDILRAGRGRDTVEGWRGNDTIYARDGARDRLIGGDGRDRARIDRGRDRTRSIERLF
jgi:Ca2+-binding RTX toxin-like protein